MAIVMVVPETDMDRDFAYDLWKQYLSDIPAKKMQEYTIRWKKEQFSENQPQLFTFTTDPSKKNEKAQEDYILGLQKRKNNLQIKRASYCKEHADTNLHFHVLIIAKKQIPPDAFKHYAKSYGKVYKSKPGQAGNEDIPAIEDYLSKESSMIKIL